MRACPQVVEIMEQFAQSAAAIWRGDRAELFGQHARHSFPETVRPHGQRTKPLRGRTDIHRDGLGPEFFRSS
jgi:hypothetical protein